MEIEYKNKSRETCSYPLTILLILMEVEDE